METEPQSCHFCDTEDGSKRPVGGFEVKLKTIEIDGTKKMACQSCQRKIMRILETKNLKQGYIMKIKETLKKIMYWALPVLAFTILFATVAYAQSPPGLPAFPDSPSAAPIDGGLSLLAAAGGAYAWKKLRDKKAE